MMGTREKFRSGDEWDALTRHGRRALKIRNWQLLTQFAVALPAAVSVFFDDGTVLYYLAFAGAVLLGLWWWLDGRYRAHREAGEAARRATLIMGGLGRSLSPAELVRLEEGFHVTSEEASAAIDARYFASTAPPSPQRLAEMVDESAFFTEKLQTASAKFMGGSFVVIVLIFAAAAGLLLPYIGAKTQIALARVFLAGLAFLLSSDVLGAVKGHRATARIVREIRLRLATVAASGYREADVLAAMTDYNSAVEGSPMTVPLVYEFKGDRLNRQWKSFLATQAAPGKVQ